MYWYRYSFYYSAFFHLLQNAKTILHQRKKVVHLKYPTLVPGLLVRSKAEADIISRLLHYEVPFRYEQEHVINGIAFYPDITCLNVTTLKEIYIDHQGAWDKPEYVEDIHRREILLAQVGIIPWHNLIITTETADHPLDINWVDLLIEHYLL